MDSGTADAPEQVVVEFIDPTTTRPGFDLLTELIDRGQIQLLDLEFIHAIDGVPSTIPASRVDRGLAHFDTAFTGAVSRSDLDTVAADLPKHTTAAILIVAGEPIADVAGAWQAHGARVSRS